MVVGDRVAQSGAVAEAVQVAELLGARVYAAAFTEVNFPTGHPQFRGVLNLNSPSSAKKLAGADALLAVGTNVFSSFLYVPEPYLNPRTRLVHLDSASREVEKVYPTEVGIISDPRAGLADLADALAQGMSGSAQEAARTRAVHIAGEKAAARVAAFRHENTGTAWWLGQEVGPYDDIELRPLAERCLLGFGSVGGPPMLPVLYNNLKRIVQTDDHIMILVEMVHDARIVRMNAEHAPPEIRSWLGDSVGHWEGDTLVVDTTNSNDTPALRQTTRDLHVVERFTRLDADTLLYRFTVEDPNVWTAPWTGEYVWPTSDTRVYEYACHEANYSFRGILGGPRVLEQDVREGRVPEPPR